MTDREPDTFTVTMLSVLRERFEEWLTANSLVMGHFPDSPPNEYIVVPVRVPPRDAP